MKVFNPKTGRYLGEIKSETTKEYIILNPYGQEVPIPKDQTILDESKAEKLANRNYEDPQKRALNQALSSEQYAGEAYRKAKMYFLVASFVAVGAGGIILLFNLLGYSGPPFVGWAMIAGFGFMFTNGLRLIKYKSRLKS